MKQTASSQFYWMRCWHKLQEDKISHDDDAQHEPHLLPPLLLRSCSVGVRIGES
jgi:hypothetical protein